MFGNSEVINSVWSWCKCNGSEQKHTTAYNCELPETHKVCSLSLASQNTGGRWVDFQSMNQPLLKKFGNILLQFCTRYLTWCPCTASTYLCCTSTCTV